MIMNEIVMRRIRRSIRNFSAQGFIVSLYWVQAGVVESELMERALLGSGGS
jgi:hypothetical protein